MKETQTEVRLMKRPTSDVVPGEHLVVFEDVPVDTSALGADEVLVEVQWLSLDPAMRGWMTDAKSYLPPSPLGEPMRANGTGKVLDSKSDKFAPGDMVSGFLNMRQLARVKAKDLRKVLVPPGTSPRLALGILGNNGLTAYFGLFEIGQPKAGETVVVSAASGATGSVVAQLAKHVAKCRVVGIAGGAKKVQWLKEELKLDDVIDYKSEDISSALKKTCPDGIDVYFDNVGGDILDEVLRRLRHKARIVLCGAISAYNSPVPKGISNYSSLIITSSRMEGFIVLDYVQQFQSALKDLVEWLSQGKLQYKEEIVSGLGNAPEAFLGLFKGSNFGKLMIKVSEEGLDIAGNKF